MVKLDCRSGFFLSVGARVFCSQDFSAADGVHGVLSVEGRVGAPVLFSLLTREYRKRFVDVSHNNL